MASAAPTDSEPAGTRLGLLNERFHEYLGDDTARIRERVLAGEVPVLLRCDSRLLLIDGADVTERIVNGTRYHTLKALAHVPLLAHLQRSLGADLPHCEQLGSALEEEAVTIRSIGLEADALREALEEVLAAKPRGGSTATDPSWAVLFELQRRCVEAAARDEVDTLLRLAQQLRGILGPSRWRVAHFVVSGGNQPRYKELSTTFFTRLLAHEHDAAPDAAHRVIYSEACDGVDDARALVADRLVNGRLAVHFLGSPIDLDEDVLGDAGRSAIDAVLPPRRV